MLPEGKVVVGPGAVVISTEVVGRVRDVVLSCCIFSVVVAVD